MNTEGMPRPSLWRFLLILGALLLCGAPASEALSAADSSGGKPATALATFAGGCFWCMQPPYDKLDGVIATTAGYTGGRTVNPTYGAVSAGVTGHAESVQVEYDPKRVSYQKLLEVFWHNIDPTARDRQFCDVGSQYRSSIFYHNEEQKRLAEESKAELERTKPFSSPVVTEIVPAGPFYAAEAYHQEYYRKNPIRYKFYRANCGRDARLQELWGRAPE